MMVLGLSLGPLSTVMVLLLIFSVSPCLPSAMVVSPVISTSISVGMMFSNVSVLDDLKVSTLIFLKGPLFDLRHHQILPDEVEFSDTSYQPSARGAVFLGDPS